MRLPRQAPDVDGGDAGQRLLPARELPCIWMTAGLVAYHLCPREYECEGCPLDEALAGGLREHGALRAAARPGLPTDRGYHASHAWVKPLDAARVRYGLDALATRLLDRLGAVVLPAEESRIERGKPACWLEDDGELIPFRSPLAGRVRGVNRAVQEDPSLLARAPYDEGWLLEVECDAVAGDREALVSAQVLRQESARHLRALHGEKLRALRAHPHAGETRCDGGRRARGLREILGTRRYHRLLRGFLG